MESPSSWPLRRMPENVRVAAPWRARRARPTAEVLLRQPSEAGVTVCGSVPPPRSNAPPRGPLQIERR
jgi:hypothetical protein